MELYQSRLREMHEEHGEYSIQDAVGDYEHYLNGITTDNMLELRYRDRKRVHNLKYFTWVEQQGKSYEEIQDWTYQNMLDVDIQSQVEEIDQLIEQFNHDTGLLK